MLGMMRRDFISLLAGAAATWPLAARAQQATRLPRIGWLVTGSPATYRFSLAAFRDGLKTLNSPPPRCKARAATQGGGELFASSAPGDIRTVASVVGKSAALQNQRFGRHCLDAEPLRHPPRRALPGQLPAERVPLNRARCERNIASSARSRGTPS